jgi:hypothetical protein
MGDVAAEPRDDRPSENPPRDDTARWLRAWPCDGVARCAAGYGVRMARARSACAARNRAECELFRCRSDGLLASNAGPEQLTRQSSNQSGEVEIHAGRN